MPEREFLCQSNGTASPNDINEANKSTSLSAQLHRRGCVYDFYSFFPPLSVCKYSIGPPKPCSGDPLLGKLPASSNSAHCRAEKWRPERNALRPQQHFAGQEGTLPTGCQRSVARSSTTGTSCRRGRPPRLCGAGSG